MIWELQGETVELELSEAPPQGSPVVIFCHPHPLHGGSMDNKIILQGYKAALKLGYGALRFNCRGVGKSTGSYGGGIQEARDLVALISKLKLEWRGFRPLLLVGYSFGASVISHALATIRGAVPAVFLIAPPVNILEVTYMDTYEGDCHVFCAENDELVPLVDTRRWYSELRISKHFHMIHEADHYFIGKTVKLISELSEALSNYKEFEPSQNDPSAI